MQLQQQSTPDDAELATVFGQVKDKFQNILKILESSQAKNSERVFNTGCLYMFTSTVISICKKMLRQQLK